MYHSKGRKDIANSEISEEKQIIVTEREERTAYWPSDVEDGKQNRPVLSGGIRIYSIVTARGE